tara:strand:- start:33738 stop:34697 length:960 start_codon:yes stop_codon:yes gene_type:complete
MAKPIDDHPIAAIFPLINDAELEELADSIERNGQREKIILLGGKILDGRNRYRACVARNITPITRPYDPKRDGDSTLQLVLDLNLNRRQLSTSQRAMIAAQAIKAIQGEAKQKAAMQQQPEPEVDEDDDATPDNIEPIDQGEMSDAGGVLMEGPTDADVPTQEEASAAAGVSRRSLVTATKLNEENPEAAEEVKAGKKSLNKAATETDAKEAGHQKERGKVKTRIRKVCGNAFADAFLEGTLLKTTKELAAFLAIDDETMPKVANLVATGWRVKRALAFVNKDITLQSTVGDLINSAIESGGHFTHNHSGWELAITKID